MPHFPTAGGLLKTRKNYSTNKVNKKIKKVSALCNVIKFIQHLLGAVCFEANQGGEKRSPDTHTHTQDLHFA